MITANSFSLRRISRDTRKEKEEEEENEWRRLAPDKERFYPWTFWKNWTIAQRTEKERGEKWRCQVRVWNIFSKITGLLLAFRTIALPNPCRMWEKISAEHRLKQWETSASNRHGDWPSWSRCSPVHALVTLEAILHVHERTYTRMICVRCTAVFQLVFCNGRIYPHHFETVIYI